MRRRDKNELEESRDAAKGVLRRDKSVGASRKTEDRSQWSKQYTPYAPKRTYPSKYQEFMAAEWRFQRNKINVGEETVVP